MRARVSLCVAVCFCAVYSGMYICVSTGVLDLSTVESGKSCGGRERRGGMRTLLCIFGGDAGYCRGLPAPPLPCYPCPRSLSIAVFCMPIRMHMRIGWACRSRLERTLGADFKVARLLFWRAVEPRRLVGGRERLCTLF